MDNAEIAAQLEGFAALLELNGASYYTARAYRRAAELIRDTRAPPRYVLDISPVNNTVTVGPRAAAMDGGGGSGRESRRGFGSSSRPAGSRSSESCRRR